MCPEIKDDWVLHPHTSLGKVAQRRLFVPPNQERPEKETTRDSSCPGSYKVPRHPSVLKVPGSLRALEKSLAVRASRFSCCPVAPGATAPARLHTRGRRPRLGSAVALEHRSSAGRSGARVLLGCGASAAAATAATQADAALRENSHEAERGRRRRSWRVRRRVRTAAAPPPPQCIFLSITEL
ncbi:Protein of unknown function [Gryllus bimaculatus]|nr:Protein of unknown function [Gryllus bimaculatus]